MRRGAFVRMTAIGVVSAIVASLVAVAFDWLPRSASEEMDRITFLYWFATVICIAIFALVAAVVVYSVWAFRAQPDDETDGPPIHGHTGLEIVWTLVPTVLVTAIAIVSAVVLARNSDAGTSPLRVHVVAQQFAWRFEYEDGAVRSGDLVLPVGRTVELDLESLDVIHSFWIPEAGQKQDVVPGINTSIVITPKRTGSFPVVCTELCGLGHATMRATARFVSEGEFDSWLADQRQAAGGGGGEKEGEADGAQVFASAGCGACHAFDPAGTDAQVGPGLDGLAAAAGAAGEEPAAYARESIVAPDAVVAEGYQPGVMPGDYADSLTDAQIDALVAYLTEEGTTG